MLQRGDAYHVWVATQERRNQSMALGVGAVFRPPWMAEVPVTQEHFSADREMPAELQPLYQLLQCLPPVAEAVFGGSIELRG